ncbi:RNase A-like domain-containing protein [Streptomyces clavifer]|uniref:RNase A-like domain-containing protein n=1 Tax=Streptomyces clavifer TaxID=68188 RepID=UPI0037F8D53C
MTVQTRSATYSDRETAQWATQQVVTRNEQRIHRWLAQGTRARLAIEAAWPSREAPVSRVLLQVMMLAGRGAVDVRGARVVLKRDPNSPHGFVVLTTVPIYL